MKNKFNNEKAYYLYLLIRKSEEKIIDLYGTDKIKKARTFINWSRSNCCRSKFGVKRRGYNF